MTYIPENPNGQAPMADSAPVVLASNHSTIKVKDEELHSLVGDRDEAPNGDIDAPMGLNARVHILAKQNETVIGGLADIIEQTAQTQANIGLPNETAAATDTATSGLNGRMKRLNQQMTSLLGKFPSLLGKRTKADSISVTIASDEMGQTTKANSLPVTLASDQGNLPTADSQVATNIGATNEAAAASDTATSGLNGLLKRLLQKNPALGQTTKSGSVPVTLASDQGNLPTADSTVATNIGATNETAAASDTATSGLNGLIKRLFTKLPSIVGQRTKADSLSVTVASDQGNVATADSTVATNIGATNETAAASDTATSGLNGLIKRLFTKLPSIVGQRTKADSLSVTVASDQGNVATADSTVATNIGATNETAAASDTATSGLNGLIKRLFTKFPSSLGNKTAANSMSVTVASDQAAVAMKVADGDNATMGAKADAAASTDTGSASEIALLKRLLTKLTADAVNAALSNTNRLAVGGSAADLAALTALTAGNAAMFRFDKETGAAICTIGDIKAIYDSITISEKLKKVSIEITRPSDGNAYAAEDMIFSSTSTGALNITGISTGLTDSDSSGYVIAAKLLSNEQNIVGKRLALLVYDAGTGSYISQDNAASITGSYSIEKDCLFQVNFDTIIDCIGNPVSDDAVVCKLEDLRIPYKLNSGTKFNLIFVTKDAFTPTSGSKFYIELTLSTNP